MKKKTHLILISIMALAVVSFVLYKEKVKEVPLDNTASMEDTENDKNPKDVENTIEDDKQEKEEAARTKDCLLYTSRCV